MTEIYRQHIFPINIPLILQLHDSYVAICMSHRLQYITICCTCSFLCYMLQPVFFLVLHYLFPPDLLSRLFARPIRDHLSSHVRCQFISFLQYTFNMCLFFGWSESTRKKFKHPKNFFSASQQPNNINPFVILIIGDARLCFLLHVCKCFNDLNQTQIEDLHYEV